MVLKARLSPEQGAMLRKALELVGPADDVSAETSGGRGTHAQRNADALVTLAQSFLAAEHTTSHGGDSHLVTVHVDAEVLAAGVEGRCELDGGPAIAAEVARRLGCDASVVAIVEDGHGNPLDVGRKTRTIPPALRRALRSRDGGCRFPGCTNRRFVDGHHVRHWSQGGKTSLSNILSLCRAHHRAVHEGGYAVEPTGDPTNPWGFRRPDGTALQPVPPALSATTHHAIKHPNAALGLGIGPATAVPGWYGERLDLDLAGARDERHLHDLRRLLARASVVATQPADYEQAAALYRTCRRRGETVRKLIDCLIAALAIRIDVPVLHADTDFDVLARHTALRVEGT